MSALDVYIIYTPFIKHLTSNTLYVIQLVEICTWIKENQTQTEVLLSESI